MDMILGVETVGNQYLFNLMNRTAPLRFIDVRHKKKFDESHLNTREFYINLPSQSSVYDDIIDVSVVADYEVLIDESILVRGSSIIVIVMESGDDDDVAVKIAAVINSRRSAVKSDECESSDLSKDWGKINTIYRMNYDTFMQTYSGCSSMFTSTTTPGAGVSVSASGHVRRKVYPSEIVPGFLFVGDYTDGSDEMVLSDLRLTHLVDATNKESSRAAAEAMGLSYLPVSIWDTVDADMTAHAGGVADFIASAAEQEGARVLVHCQAGISRAATLTMAYLIRSGRATLRAAIELLVTHRPQVCPNQTFRAFLVKFEVAERGHSSMMSPPADPSLDQDVGGTDADKVDVDLCEKAAAAAADKAFMDVVRAHSNLWTAWAGVETNHDRKPIIAGRLDEGTLFRDAYPPPPTAVEGAGADNGAGDSRTKRNFLKRGGGKGVATSSPQTQGHEVAAGGASGEVRDTQKQAIEASALPLSPLKPCPASRVSIAELKRAHKEKAAAAAGTPGGEGTDVVASACVGLCGVRVLDPGPAGPVEFSDAQPTAADSACAAPTTGAAVGSAVHVVRLLAADGDSNS